MSEHEGGATEHPRVIAMIGGEERVVRHARTQAQLSELSTASFGIAASDGPVDLTAGVQLLASATRRADGDGLLPIFTGRAIAANTSAGTLNIEAGSGLELREGEIGILHVAGDVALDTIYMLCTQAGQQVAIEGMQAPVREVFAIEMPLTGVDVKQAVKGMGVELLPLSQPGEGEFGPFTDAIEQITERWGRPSARARAYVVGQRMYDAELMAISKIEPVVNALIATASYGFSRDPWDRALPFDRSQARARPTLLPVVFSQGLTTGRRWLHDSGGQQSTHLDVGASFSRWAEVLRDQPAPEISLGLSALRDAADDARDMSERCHAFCTVLEYYAAASRPRPVVSDAVKRQVLRSLANIEMTETEQRRLRDYIGQVNTPPLLARVRHQVDQDRTPLSEAEWSLIAKLRKARNDSVHGRLDVAHKPTAEDLRWGVSIASRLLLYRWVRANG